MVRPRRVVVVAGTGTEVGKTFVGAAVCNELASQRRSVIARKPAQSFDADDLTTDASVLGAATGADPEVVCPAHRWYPVPMAPPMAAVALGREPFTVEDLAGEVEASFTEADIALVVTAGGAWSPQASDGKHVGDFADALDADAILLVADAGLGVINAVRGALAALSRPRPVIVMLNRYVEADGLHVANRDWLIHEDHLSVATTVSEAASQLLAL
jgi:dethiobiotin synthetase